MLNFLNEISDFNTEALDGDIVKLSGINRALVFQGLKVIARTKNLGFGNLQDSNSSVSEIRKEFNKKLDDIKEILNVLTNHNTFISNSSRCICIF